MFNLSKMLEFRRADVLSAGKLIKNNKLKFELQSLAVDIFEVY